MIKLLTVLLLLADAHSHYARIQHIEVYQGNQRRVVSTLKKVEKRKKIVNDLLRISCYTISVR